MKNARENLSVIVAIAAMIFTMANAWADMASDLRDRVLRLECHAKIGECKQ